MKDFRYILLFLFCLGTIQSTFAQKKYRIKIQNADSLKNGVRNGEQYTKLFGNAHFIHENTIIYCDTAYSFDRTNTMEAIGHVKILQGDSITITGKKLFYNGNTKLAQFREDVVYRDDSITIYTDFLDYDMPGKLAYYFNGGKVVDNKNVLISDKGYYDTRTKFSSFKDDAVLTTPEAVISGDTLQYDLNSDIAYFKGPTKIVKKDGTTLNAYKGKYITRIEKSEIEKGVIESGDQVLEGDVLDFNEVTKFYTSTGHVKVISEKDEVIILGDFGKYWAQDSIIKIYGNALMKKAFNDDTLYLSADTLVSIDNIDPKKKRLLAYNNVKVYHNEMQGKADSLAYHQADSIIYFYDDPIIWNGGNQIVADSINMVIRNDQIDRMNMTQNSFVISLDSLLIRHNQIKGRDMIAYFQENKINKVDVFGNAESIYFVAENDTVFFGMNKILCSDMSILFKDGEVNSINTYVNPDATLIPPHEIEEPDTRLKDYRWRQDEKPTKEEVINHSSDVEEIIDKKTTAQKKRIEDRE